MQPDDELNLLRTHWPEEMVPAGLAERITRTALRQPQWQPWWARLTLTLASWNEGWSYKGAALAAVAVLGLISGQLNAPQSRTGLLQTPGMSWSEGL
ncbi:MAG: hypothetical protein ACKVOE_09805 [Rickettsiales bacterium]